VSRTPARPHLRQSHLGLYRSSKLDAYSISHDNFLQNILIQAQNSATAPITA
jgi:hypothetical protein